MLKILEAVVQGTVQIKQVVWLLLFVLHLIPIHSPFIHPVWNFETLDRSRRPSGLSF